MGFATDMSPNASVPATATATATLAIASLVAVVVEAVHLVMAHVLKPSGGAVGVAGVLFASSVSFLLSFPPSPPPLLRLLLLLRRRRQQSSLSVPSAPIYFVRAAFTGSLESFACIIHRIRPDPTRVEVWARFGLV